MTFDRRCLCCAVLISLVGAGPLRAQETRAWDLDQAVDNDPRGREEVDPGFCIIRPEEPASPEIYVDYNGQRVYFCCQSCRQDFLSDPSRFDALIEPAAGGDSAELEHWNPSVDPYAHSFWGRVGRSLLLVGAAIGWIHRTFHLHDPTSATLAAAAAGWLACLTCSWRSSIRKSIGLRPSPVTAALVTLMLAPCFYANSLRLKLIDARQQLAESETQRVEAETKYGEVFERDLIHYATFFNYGNPPIPRPSKLPPSLRKTYYRGNDDRSDEQVNGGNYRTVTFELWIEDSGGTPVEAGSRIVDPQGNPAPLFIVVRFIRSPNTSSGYFTAKYMQRMYVTMETGDFLGRDEPVADRVSWQMTEHEKVWVARYPLPDGVIVAEKESFDTMTRYVRTTDPSRPADRGGILYLCEDRFWLGKVIGGRFHYAVRYDLRTRDGIVQPQSDLWMQATYHGRNFADLQIEDDEWLSSEPIPEK